jgi:hypothetical protein
LPFKVSENDEVDGMIIADRRFRPRQNIKLRSGKTLLLRLCSVAETTEDLYSKADLLFVQKVDPQECSEGIVMASQAGNFYIVWLILKVLSEIKQCIKA